MQQDHTWPRNRYWPQIGQNDYKTGEKNAKGQMIPVARGHNSGVVSKTNPVLFLGQTKVFPPICTCTCRGPPNFCPFLVSQAQVLPMGACASDASPVALAALWLGVALGVHGPGFLAGEMYVYHSGPLVENCLDMPGNHNGIYDVASFPALRCPLSTWMGPELLSKNVFVVLWVVVAVLDFFQFSVLPIHIQTCAERRWGSWTFLHHFKDNEGGNMALVP